MHFTSSSLTSAAYTDVRANAKVTTSSDKRLILVSFSIGKVDDDPDEEWTRRPCLRYTSYNRYIGRYLYTSPIHLSRPLRKFFGASINRERRSNWQYDSRVSRARPACVS